MFTFRAVAKALADRMKSGKNGSDLTQKLEQKIADRIGDDCQVKKHFCEFTVNCTCYCIQ